MSTSLNSQVGGNHYSKRLYQPIQLAAKMHFSLSQGAITKYISRYKDKNGAEDLKKAIHFCQLAAEVKDYSRLYTFFHKLFMRKTKRELSKYAICNDMPTFAKCCLYDITVADFNEAEIDLRLLLAQEYNE